VNKGEKRDYLQRRKKTQFSGRGWQLEFCTGSPNSRCGEKTTGLSRKGGQEKAKAQKKKTHSYEREGQKIISERGLRIKRGGFVLLGGREKNLKKTWPTAKQASDKDN